MMDYDLAEYLIDFSGGQEKLKDLGHSQKEGAVALFNMLEKQGLAYLADEVGMGKTYIALGVVAMMRRLKPSLKVLYLAPKNNVRDKWVKEYNSFVGYNYKLTDLCVKSLDQRPAVPFTACPNLASLIQSIATGYYHDYFICSSALSFGLGNDKESLLNSLKKLEGLLPGHFEQAEKLVAEIKASNEEENLWILKKRCKDIWAQALNKVLPTFDLIVVDEAHNFKKSIDSSDRNRLLAQVLGVSPNENGECLKRRVNKVLLLSATPYDRDLNHLRNQLRIFGHLDDCEDSPLIDCKLANDDKDGIKASLKKFMVRRLNEISIHGKKHTRNMYRDEHRCGTQAEVEMSAEQQLFSALIQKKVCEVLNKNYAGKFQTGMLASFESYLTGKDKSVLVEFDGKEDDQKGEEAKDRNIVQLLIESYQKTFNKRPPHPKMDWVTGKIAKQAFTEGHKQLIFVRRVKSVPELKGKLEEAYDLSLKCYLEKAKDKAVLKWLDHFVSNLRDKSYDNLDDSNVSEQGDTPARNDNFFTWFYRGKNDLLSKDELGVTPHDFRNKLAQRSTIFELNWPSLIGEVVDESELRQYATGQVDKNINDTNDQKRFVVAQYAYLKCLKKEQGKYAQLAGRLLNYLYSGELPKISERDSNKLGVALKQVTLVDLIAENDATKVLFPDWGSSLIEDLVVASPAVSERKIKRLEIHRNLLGVICRLDHPFIDLYSLRHQEDENSAFFTLLLEQSQQNKCGTSFDILKNLSENLDLIIKLNFSDAYHKRSGELVVFFTRQVAPLSPVIGATGETSGSRSAQARRFRMPGYPLVLVSTDVFQEGEDLHTFCDRVTHFGLSANPIALEQKVGRVDRVGSKAHRNIKSNESEAEEHFIQVYYPHIKESIEFFQVRNMAANLNAFQRSLHDVENEVNESNSELDIHKELLNTSAVAKQIRERLITPYPAETPGSKDMAQFKEIASNYSNLEARIKSAQSLLEKKLVTPFTQGMNEIISRGKLGEEVRLRCARGLGELILSVTSDAREAIPFQSSLSAVDLLEIIKVKSVSPYNRVQAVKVTDGYQLYRNVEMYAGDEGELSQFEIDDLLLRAKGEPSDLVVQVETNLNTLVNDSLSALYELCSVPSVKVHLEGNSFVFTFEAEGRKQRVYFTEDEGYIHLNSTAVGDEHLLEVAEAAPALLLDYTWLRNREIDLVDFHINQQDDLAVRACHPLSHLNPKELMFAAWMVASEADRLEFILSGNEDIF